MKIAFAKPAIPDTGALVAGVYEDRILGTTAAELDELTGGQVSRALKAGRFKGDLGQTVVLTAPHGVTLDRIVLVGLGKPGAPTARTLETVGGAAVAALGPLGDTAAALAIDPVPATETGKDDKGGRDDEDTGATSGADDEAPATADHPPLSAAQAAAHAAMGATLRAFRFDRYRTTEKPEDKPALKTLTILTGDSAGAKAAFAPLQAVAEGVFLTRRLVSEPANVIYPESFVEAVRDLTDLGVTIEVLDETRMRKLGMGALLGVAQGSARPPRLLVMEYRGASDADAPPIAFIGKGVTFDSGGISIKPSASMEDMKWDMGGAGVVAGLMKALAGRKANANVVGLCGLVENMPSGTAQRPGDVVTTMSGQTVEVINTDAEGRLVLADVMWYGQDRFKPSHIIDLATLTGAIIISLGSEHAGLFSNNDALAGAIADAGNTVGEKVWRLPLGEGYDKMIRSDIADMKNVGNREAGSITAAQFLQRYLKDKDTPWAHIDIAGVTWSKKNAPTVPKGGTAFGVRLLDRLVTDLVEDRDGPTGPKGKEKGKAGKGKDDKDKSKDDKDKSKDDKDKGKSGKGVKKK